MIQLIIWDITRPAAASGWLSGAFINSWTRANKSLPMQCAQIWLFKTSIEQNSLAPVHTICILQELCSKFFRNFQKLRQWPGRIGLEVAAGSSGHSGNSNLKHSNIHKVRNTTCAHCRHWRQTGGSLPKLQEQAQFTSPSHKAHTLEEYALEEWALLTAHHTVPSTPCLAIQSSFLECVGLMKHMCKLACLPLHTASQCFEGGGEAVREGLGHFTCIVALVASWVPSGWMEDQVSPLWNKCLSPLITFTNWSKATM